VNSRAVGPTGNTITTYSKTKRSVTKHPKHKNSNNTKHPVDRKSNITTGLKMQVQYETMSDGKKHKINGNKKKKEIASRFLSYPIPSPLTFIIYIVSNDGIILNSRLERMRKGAAVAYLLLLSQHVAEGNEKPKS
jgi:hypothetical protein